MFLWLIAHLCYIKSTQNIFKNLVIYSRLYCNILVNKGDVILYYNDIECLG